MQTLHSLTSALFVKKHEQKKLIELFEQCSPEVPMHKTGDQSVVFRGLCILLNKDKNAEECDATKAS